MSGGRKSFIGGFIDSIRQELSANKEMKVNLISTEIYVLYFYSFAYILCFKSWKFLEGWYFIVKDVWGL